MTDGAASAATSDKPRVLVFCRHYLVPDFRNNFAPLANEFAFSFLTDGHAPGTEDTRRRFYELLAKGARCDALDAADEEDVRLRCRLLRNLSTDQALAMMHAMAIIIEETLDRLRPKVIVGHLVDEYIQHLFALLGGKRNIRFVNYFASYFAGHVQLTQHAYGAPFDIYEPSDAQVDKALATIQQPKFRQNYNQNSGYALSRHVWGMMRYRVKLAAFWAKSVLERDPWNLHYAITPYIAERRRLRDFPRPAHFDNQWASTLRELASRRPGPIVYLPLSYFPEATSDYWVSNLKILDYDARMLEAARALTRGNEGIVVVKEHLHMMGARDGRLYAELQRIPNVVNVPPLEFSNIVLDACDAVVMGGGSIGIEATARGKPVFSYCESSYWFKPSRAQLLDIDAIDRWRERIRTSLQSYRANTHEENRQFIRDCMRSNVPARSGGRIWPLIETEYLRRTLLNA